MQTRETCDEKETETRRRLKHEREEIETEEKRRRILDTRRSEEEMKRVTLLELVLALLEGIL